MVFRTSLIERTEEKLLVHPHIGWNDGHVREARSFAMSKLTDVVDGVVVIEGEQVLPTRSKGIRLPYELKRTRGIGCEDSRIVIGGRVELVKHVSANMLNQDSHSLGSRIGRVGIAEHVAAK